MNLNKPFLCAAMLACGLLSSHAANAVVPRFDVTVFTMPVSSIIFASGSALSDNGLVGGVYMSGYSNGDPIIYGYRSTGLGGQTVTLPKGWQAFDINNAGTMAIPAVYGISGVVPGEHINNAGQYTDGTQLFTPGAAVQTILPLRTGNLSGINDAGQVSGHGYYTDRRSFVYSAGSYTYLSSGSYAESDTTGISNNGNVSGYVYNDFNAPLGAAWIGGQLNVIPDMASAVGVSSNGLVVGNSQGRDSIGLLWMSGTTYKLADLIDPALGMQIIDVRDINENNQILVRGCNSHDCYVVRLDPTTPVPEPETYGMMLGGLGLLAYVARRRRRA